MSGAPPREPRRQEKAAIDTKRNKSSGSSGSEKRQRPHVVSVRLNARERAELNSRAERAGISAGAYLRHQGLDVPPPRQRNRPAVEVQVLSRLVGQLGKLGSNLNQIAHRINTAAHISSLDVMFVKNMIDELGKLRDLALKTMGRAP